MEKVQNSKKSRSSFWDSFGVGVSALCVVHCVLLPVLIFVAPAILSGVVPHEDWTHAVLLGFILGIAGVAFITGYRVHGQIRPVLWMVAGVLIITYATFFAHSQLGHMWEPVIAIIGSLALIRAHILNHRCKTCEEHECDHDPLHTHK